MSHSPTFLIHGYSLQGEQRCDEIPGTVLHMRIEIEREPENKDERVEIDREYENKDE